MIRARALNTVPTVFYGVITKGHYSLQFLPTQGIIQGKALLYGGIITENMVGIFLLILNYDIYSWLSLTLNFCPWTKNQFLNVIMSVANSHKICKRFLSAK